MGLVDPTEEERARPATGVFERGGQKYKLLGGGGARLERRSVEAQRAFLAEVVGSVRREKWRGL